MRNLRLRLNMFGDEKLGTTTVIGNVFPNDRSAPMALRKKLRDLAIPAGDNFDRWTQVEVPPGSYEIQILLPSGDVISQDASIEAGTDEPFDVALEAPSPHEWLAAQHFQGNVGSRDHLRVDDKDWLMQGLNRGFSDLSTLEQKGFTADMRAEGAADAAPVLCAEVIWCADKMPDVPADVAPADSVQADSIWDTLYQIISENLPAMDATNRFMERSMAGFTLPANPVYDMDSVRTFRFVFDGPVPLGVAEPVNYHVLGGAPPARRYVMVSDAEDARLISAPVPWFDLSDYGREVAFELMSPLGSVGVTTAVRDTTLGSILGYMTNNSIHQARLIVNRAKDMLFHKISNPLGAAAGAYVMLLTENERSGENWHQWIRNLYQGFEWIPDGAIAYAMLKLNHQKSDADVTEALEATLQACRRGVPFYSMGMRFLLDTLTEFAEDDLFADRRDELLHHLKRVRVVARRTNYQQPFTSIQISRPGR